MAEQEKSALLNGPTVQVHLDGKPLPLYFFDLPVREGDRQLEQVSGRFGTDPGKLEPDDLVSIEACILGPTGWQKLNVPCALVLKVGPKTGVCYWRNSGPFSIK